MQWCRTILPRIQAFVPAASILEIAPGYGRWTEKLKGLCQRLTVVDLSEKCIEACQARFQSDTHITYHVNDGKSLAMVPDRSVDFVFSFDSLVHAERDVLEAYLSQIAGKLTPDGVGFLHHSNAGEYAAYFTLVGRLPDPGGLIDRTGIIERNRCWRALSVTADWFAEVADGVGLQCLTQELINWRSRRLIDCLSVFTLKTSRRARPNRRLRNKHFMAEAKESKRLASRLAGSYAFPGPPG
jgi:SAM-dependent methyltransferase